jgi:hypothetical protein
MTRVNIKIKLNQVIRNEIEKNIKKFKTKYITVLLTKVREKYFSNLKKCGK